MGGIGRVTGLDPAEPYFEEYHTDARLDPSDATFVDVIHTDVASILALGFGSKEAMGHVDYYPNNGTNQPGCDIGITDINSIHGAKQYVVCNHERSYKILIEAIRAKAEGRTCHFKAHRCSSYDSYLKEECQDCGEGCTFIGPDALVTRPKTSDVHVHMYLITLGQAPFCGDKFFDFSASLPSGFKKDRGQIFVKIDLTSQGGPVIDWWWREAISMWIKSTKSKFATTTTGAPLIHRRGQFGASLRFCSGAQLFRPSSRTNKRWTAVKRDISVWDHLGPLSWRTAKKMSGSLSLLAWLRTNFFHINDALFSIFYLCFDYLSI